MMLYTFVENSVKYGLVDEAEGVHITLQIEKSREGEKQGYYFRIRDSGPGYAEDVLPVLNSGDTLLDRRGGRTLWRGKCCTETCDPVSWRCGNKI